MLNRSWQLQTVNAQGCHPPPLGRLHIIVQLAGLGEHALDAGRCGRATEELTRHLGQVRQAFWAATR